MRNEKRKELENCYKKKTCKIYLNNTIKLLHERTQR